MTRRTKALTDADFERLLRFRDGLRRFLHWSEDRARAVGLTAAQHQLLLAIRGSAEPPSIRDVAGHLLLRHHSVVELVDRAVRAGLVARSADPDDQRVVRLHLTAPGEEKLVALSELHLEELVRLARSLPSVGERLPGE